MSKVRITHIEWNSKDFKGLTQFMTDLFGFKFDPFGEGYMFYAPPNPDGVSIGISHDEKVILGGGTPSVYIEVASVDETLAKSTKLGGTTTVPRTVITAEMGAFAFIKAPDGNIIGLHEEAKR